MLIEVDLPDDVDALRAIVLEQAGELDEVKVLHKGAAAVVLVDPLGRFWMPSCATSSAPSFRITRCRSVAAGPRECRAIGCRLQQRLHRAAAAAAVLQSAVSGEDATPGWGQIGVCFDLAKAATSGSRHLISRSGRKPRCPGRMTSLAMPTHQQCSRTSRTSSSSEAVRATDLKRWHGPCLTLQRLQFPNRIEYADDARTNLGALTAKYCRLTHSNLSSARVVSVNVV